MKICYIRTDHAFGVQFGGSVTHISGFVKGIKELGHELFFISTDKLAYVDEPTVVVKPPVLLRGTISFQRILYNYVFINKALKIIKKEKPDFIYQRHSIHNFSGVRLAKKTGLPFILESNGSEVWAEKYWGGLRFEKIAANIENECFAGADIIMVVSNEVKKQHIAMGVDADKIKVNPNGVDPQHFDCSIDGEPVRCKYNLQDKVVVGFVGSFSHYHGMHILAEAIKIVVKANPNVHFLMIGKGALRDEFDSTVREAQVTGNVTNINVVPHHEIQNYLAACDIVVSPQTQNADGSEFFGSPTKLFEYMAMGKAIVASKVGQIKEILTDGKSALLVEPSDPVQLADAILKFAADDKLRKALGKEALQIVLSEYTWKHNASRVVDAYQEYQNNSAQ